MLEQLQSCPSPAYVLDEAAFLNNLENLKDVKERAGCKIILALKGYSFFPSFNIIKPYLDGTTASGIYEAKLGHKHFGKEVHVYSPAYDDAEIEALLPIANHMIFNSPSQLKKYAGYIKQQAANIHIGLRINPEIEEVSTTIYNPCAPCSRMGSVASEIDDECIELIDGLHFHILCESMDSSSTRLIDYVEQHFDKWLKKMKWINFGGGHYINHPDYNKENLIKRIQQFKQKYPHLEVILEPGGTVVYNTGYLVSTVLDIIKNQKDIVILDTSATAHMPDVLEMPYRPNLYRLSPCLRGELEGGTSDSSLRGGKADAAIHPNEQEFSSDGLLPSSELTRNDDYRKNSPPACGGSWREEEACDQGTNPNEKPHNYLLTGRTCLTGDIIGEYSFDNPLQIGDRIIFTDMMQYSFVKNTTFNGIPLPELGILKTDGTYHTYRKFSFEDFESRLG